MLDQLVSALYPVCTLVLIFWLILLTVRNNQRAMRPVTYLLFVAFTVLTITNTIYNFQQLHDYYLTGTLLDLGWPLGFLLLGLAARAIYLLPHPQATVQAKDNKRT